MYMGASLSQGLLATITGPLDGKQTRRAWPRMTRSK